MLLGCREERINLGKDYECTILHENLEKYLRFSEEQANGRANLKETEAYKTAAFCRECSPASETKPKTESYTTKVVKKFPPPYDVTSDVLYSLPLQQPVHFLSCHRKL